MRCQKEAKSSKLITDQNATKDDSEQGKHFQNNYTKVYFVNVKLFVNSMFTFSF